MTQDDLKLVLEALKWRHGGEPCGTAEAIAVVEKALAQEQEPVAWADIQKEAQQIVESKFLWKKFIDGTPLSNDIACWMADFAQQYTASPQPEQEPVAWMDVDGKTFPFVWNVSSLGVQQGSKYLDETLTPLYTHPPQRTWVGLTDVEIDYLLGSTVGENEETHISFARAIESKIKELNT